MENCKSQSSCLASEDAQNLLVLRCDAHAICIEVLCCFRKVCHQNSIIYHLVGKWFECSLLIFSSFQILNLPDLYVKRNVSVIADLWKAFQPVRIAGDICSGITPFPSSGSMNYLYCGVYSYLEDLLSVGNATFIVFTMFLYIFLDFVELKRFSLAYRRFWLPSTRLWTFVDLGVTCQFCSFIICKFSGG